MIKIGNNKIIGVMYGSTEIIKVFKGTDLVYQKISDGEPINSVIAMFFDQGYNSTYNYGFTGSGNVSENFLTEENGNVYTATGSGYYAGDGTMNFVIATVKDSIDLRNHVIKLSWSNGACNYSSSEYLEGGVVTGSNCGIIFTEGMVTYAGTGSNAATYEYMEDISKEVASLGYLIDADTSQPYDASTIAGWDLSDLDIWIIPCKIGFAQDVSSLYVALTIYDSTVNWTNASDTGSNSAISTAGYAYLKTNFSTSTGSGSGSGSGSGQSTKYMTVMGTQVVAGDGDADSAASGSGAGGTVTFTLSGTDELSGNIVFDVPVGYENSSNSWKAHYISGSGQSDPGAIIYSPDHISAGEVVYTQNAINTSIETAGGNINDDFVTISTSGNTSTLSIPFKFDLYEDQQDITFAFSVTNSSANITYCCYVSLVRS